MNMNGSYAAAGPHVKNDNARDERKDRKLTGFIDAQLALTRLLMTSP
jgi:hypothetical protein